MNRKDRSINELVKALHLEDEGWVVFDHWEADRCAIGIAREGHTRQLVYISTFGRASGKYNYECEMPAGPEVDDYRTTETGEDVDFGSLVRAIKKHLAPENND